MTNFDKPIYDTINFLVGEAESQRLVVFVGAGCPMSAGLPGWVTLLEKIKTANDIKISNDNVLRLALYLEKKLGFDKFREAICNQLDIKPDSSKMGLYRAIANLPVNLFITTNYD